MPVFVSRGWVGICDRLVAYGTNHRLRDECADIPRADSLEFRIEFCGKPADVLCVRLAVFLSPICETWRNMGGVLSEERLEGLAAEDMPARGQRAQRSAMIRWQPGDEPSPLRLGCW